MVKNIWLVNKYAMPPQYESRLRTIKFAHYLQEMGYRVTIFGSSVMHNMDIDLIEGEEKYIERQYDDLRFVHVKSSQYKKTAGISRVWSDIQFHYRLVNLAKKFEKPDLVVATTFPLISNPLLKYCKKHDIRYITEVLDWWPDDFIDFGLMSAKNPMMKYLFWRAKKNYAESDATVFSIEGRIEYLKDKKWDAEQGGPVEMSRMFYINNGVDLADFDSWVNQYQVDDEDLKTEKKRIIYMGAIRMANNICQLIKAAEMLKNRDDVEFLIYGNGEDRKPLIDYCERKKLDKIKFKNEWLDPKYVPFVLSQAYLNILNYTKGFGKYGISSSKLFQYLASGRPIVCNIDVMYSVIDKYNIGVCHEMKDEQDYANALITILGLSEEKYLAMCKRAREAVKVYDYPNLALQMAEVIKKIEDLE